MSSAIAPYVQIVEQSIREDLARVIPQEQIDEEVRKTLIRQIALETTQAINELIQQYHYGNDEQRHKTELKAIRYMGYLGQVLSRVESLRLLPATTSIDSSHDELPLF